MSTGDSTDSSDSAPAELPDEVLAELMGLIDAMHEESPASQEAARAELASDPDRSYAARPNAFATRPTAFSDLGADEQFEHPADEAPWAEADFNAGFVVDDDEPRVESDADVGFVVDGDAPVIDLSDSVDGGFDHLFAGVSAEARLHPTAPQRSFDIAWLRENWPFVVAAVFIALGVLLILLVLVTA